MSTATATDRSRIADVFQILEDAGIVTRMNFMCCSGCALAKLEDEGVDEETPFVFFHQQDNEFSFDDEGDGDTLTSTLMIRHGGPGAARAAYAAFRAAGFTVVWNGDDGQCIQVGP